MGCDTRGERVSLMTAYDGDKSARLEYSADRAVVIYSDGYREDVSSVLSAIRADYGRFVPTSVPTSVPLQRGVPAAIFSGLIKIKLSDWKAGKRADQIEAGLRDAMSAAVYAQRSRRRAWARPARRPMVRSV